MQNNLVILDSYGEENTIAIENSFRNKKISEGYKSVNTPGFEDLIFKNMDDFERVEDEIEFSFIKKEIKGFYSYIKHKRLDFYTSMYKGNIVSTFLVNPIIYAEFIEYIENNLQLKGSEIGKGKPKMNLLMQTTKGYSLSEFELKELNLDIDTMYNDDFKPIYEHTLNGLKNAGKGIVLFYGDPGTGKSTLIKYLSSQISDAFIYIPSNFIPHLNNPELIQFLYKYPNSILVVEDCETYIKSRENSEVDVVSSLLQITDGILSDILGIRVICTFNTDVQNIDKALLRPGRLISKYEFKPLVKEKAEALLNGRELEGDYTIANIFDNMTYRGEEIVNQPKIGFR